MCPPSSKDQSTVVACDLRYNTRWRWWKDRSILRILLRPVKAYNIYSAHCRCFVIAIDTKTRPFKTNRRTTSHSSISPPPAIPATLSLRSIATEGSDRVPWSNESIQPFIPSTHRRRFHNFRKLSKYHRSLTSAFHADMLRYKLRRANRELIENRDCHPPFLYLGELIRLPYLVIGLYWVFCLFLIRPPFAGIQNFRMHANDPNYTLCQFRTPHILGFLQCVLRFLQAFFAASIISSFSTMMALVTLVEAILFARRPFQPAKLTG
jgi:hypothetical protein